MVGYCCKYTPIELITALGGEPFLLDGEEWDFETAESLTHSNLCCHAKSLIQQGLQREELVLMDCCDSVRRAADVLQASGAHVYFRLLDLPHEDGRCARARLKEELMGLLRSYALHTGVPFQRDTFLQACRRRGDTLANTPFLAVFGARIPPSVLELMHGLPLPVINLTCTGNRQLEPPPGGAEDMDTDGLMDWYAGALLRMPPCMRMADVQGRRRLTESPFLKGIIYNTVKFCDYYGFEYAELKQRTRLPILKIETDYASAPLGQLSTRLEAFGETLLAGEQNGRRQKRRAAAVGLYAGIDSGSTTTNMVVIDENREILASAIVRTGAKAQTGAAAAMDAVCKRLSIEPDALSTVFATGYGRNAIPFAAGVKTEIACHARGAYFLNPGVRTVIDIGGQDSKVIRLDESGAVRNFIMNDKCAAGTGRFLEMMARTLEMDIEQMSKRGLDWKKDLTISSMCTVFAESEVISLIADSHSESDIIHGLNKSIASKTASMVSRANGEPPFMMTGGVARNGGVVRELEEKLGKRLFIAESPDLCGALGAALFALEEAFRTNTAKCPKV